MNFIFLALLAIFSFVIFSCSSLEIQVPLATIKSPEVATRSNTRIEALSLPYKFVTTTTDASSRPPTFKPTELTTRLAAGSLSYSFLDRLQAGIALDSLFSTSINAQYQFYGEKNKIGWISSINASSSYANRTKKGDQNGIFGAGGYPWEGTIAQRTFEFGLSLGYRIREDILIFTGISSAQTNIETTIKQSANSDGSSAGGSYENKISAPSKAAGLGFQFDFGNMHFTPIAQWTEFTFGDTRTDSVQGVVTLSFYN